MSDIFDNKTFRFLNRVMLEFVTSAAEGSAYRKNWGDEFACMHNQRVWQDADDGGLRQAWNQKVSIADLKTLNADQRTILGIGNWDENLRVIPLWMYNYIKDGETLKCIDGDTVIKGQDEIDLDVRFGCIAFGFEPAREAQNETTG